MFWRYFKRSAKYSLPLDATDAVTTGPLVEVIPPERRYMLGPFLCDTSPVSHTGPFSEAVDFVVYDGAEVKAARSGTVIDIVEHHTTYGPTKAHADRLNYLTIDHGDSQFSQYAHVAPRSVSGNGITLGKHVMRGQVIARTGKTGWVEYEEVGDHLHFMVFTETGASPGFVTIPIQWQFT